MKAWEKTSLYQEPSQSPGFLLWRISLAWKRKTEIVLDPLQLTHPQFIVLAGIGWLTRSRTAISQTDLARHIDMDQNTLSQVLRGLEHRRLVTRHLSLGDHSKNPRLTARGKTLLEQAIKQVEASDLLFFEPSVNLAPTALQILSLLLSAQA